MLELNFDPFPVLTTERLVLRKVTPEDAEAIFVMRSDEKVMVPISRPLATSIDDANKMVGIFTDLLEKNEAITWGICLKDDNRLIGTIGFWNITVENYRAEIGYMLASAFHRQGIMQEALPPVLRYGFEVMKLHSVEADISPANIASAKLLTRNGFEQEGYFKDTIFYNGRFSDTAVYTLLTTIL